MQTAILTAPQSRVEQPFEINESIIGLLINSINTEARVAFELRKHRLRESFSQFVNREITRHQYARISYNIIHSTLRDEMRLEAKRWFFE
jgi:hypothetical protein